MLSRLFTSKARVKLLTVFLLNPEDEFYVRELTRKLDEQINAVRRELDNLKKLGLLKCRTKNRHKYYSVNTQFVLYPDLRNLFLKSLNSHAEFVKKLQKSGNLELVLLAGIFVNNQESEVDLLLVGDIDREILSNLLTTELDFEREVKFALLSKDDFIYRVKFNDRFLSDLLGDEANILAVNKIEKIS